MLLSYLSPLICYQYKSHILGKHEENTENPVCLDVTLPVLLIFPSCFFAIATKGAASAQCFGSTLVSMRIRNQIRIQGFLPH